MSPSTFAGAAPDFPAILVLGATGRVGRILQRAWSRQPPPAPVLWQGRAQAAPPERGGDWHWLDPLQDPQSLARAAAGAGTILCLAGVTPYSPDRPMSDNIALALAAIRAAAPRRARVLLASSAAVYGARSGRLTETDPPSPVSAYGRAKAGMEQQGAALARDLSVPLCSLRIGNIAGADAILGGWRPGFALDLFPDGRTPRRSYIGPRSLADLLARLATCSGPLPPVLNLAAPAPVEMGALLDAAGLAWTPRPAPPEAIALVDLATDALQALLPLDPATALPHRLVSQWREHVE